MTVVIKRDGSKVPFDAEKIASAVSRAFAASVHGSYALCVEAIVSRVCEYVGDYDEIDVEGIQDVVERQMMKYSPAGAKAFIVYRYEHGVQRDKHQAFIHDMERLLAGSNHEVNNENANKDSKMFNVKRDLMAGMVSKFFAKEKLPSEVLKAHEEGLIHFHDMDYSPALPMTNCCLADIGGMLRDGFKLGNADIETPKSFGVACAVTAQIIAQVASSQYGGTSFADIDIQLEPYVEASYKKWLHVGLEAGIMETTKFADQHTKKEVYDGIQALELTI